MRLKIFILIIALLGLLFLSMFGSQVKEAALKGMVKEIPEYSCQNNLCTACIINGNTCKCGNISCTCGNKTFDKKECEF